MTVADTAAGDRNGTPSGQARAHDSAYGRELAFAADTAERAGRLLMERYERVEQVTYKSARDVVTEVDLAAERQILDAIRAAFPDDAILAEELGSHAAAVQAAGGRTWIVDPLDGTVNYANGIPVFCVSIALADGDRPVVGVVHDPTRADTFRAAVDGPATLNGRSITCSEKERLGDFVVAMALSGRAVTSRLRAVRKAIRIGRTMGSAAIALAYTANGRFDAYLQSSGLSVWDVAAAGLIAERGGARVTSPSGGPWFDIGQETRTIGIVAAPPAHHARLLELSRG